MSRVTVADTECFAPIVKPCSQCGQRVQAGAPGEDCCPSRYDKPAPQWVRDFHAKHGVWPAIFEAARDQMADELARTFATDAECFARLRGDFRQAITRATFLALGEVRTKDDEERYGEDL